MDPSYPAKIDAFKKAFNTLNEVWGLSETPKVHIVLQHLGEYLDSAKETLWTCSDENVEASVSREQNIFNAKNKHF